MWRAGWVERSETHPTRYPPPFIALCPFQQSPQLGERAFLLDAVEERKDLHRRRIVDRPLRAGEELLLDLLLRERRLHGATGVVAQLLHGAPVRERHGHPRRALLNEVGEFRIDRDRDLAGQRL